MLLLGRKTSRRWFGVRLYPELVVRNAWLGNNNYAWVNNNLRWNNLHVSQDVDLVTARINYRFGGPAVVRY